MTALSRPQFGRLICRRACYRVVSRLSKCCPKGWGWSWGWTKVVAILRIFYAVLKLTTTWKPPPTMLMSMLAAQQQNLKFVKVWKRRRAREWRVKRALAVSVLGIRVLFSLHFSCITSMAIVYVNFDVSAKVVKCEVLDVLIALCRSQLLASRWSELAIAARTPRVRNYRLDRWRMPKRKKERKKRFKWLCWPAWYGQTCRVGHFKINSSLLDGKRNQQQQQLMAGKIDTRQESKSSRVESSRLCCLISYLFCLHVSFEFSVLIEWEVRWACSFPSHIQRAPSSSSPSSLSALLSTSSVATFLRGFNWIFIPVPRCLIGVCIMNLQYSPAHAHAHAQPRSRSRSLSNSCSCYCYCSTRRAREI